MSVAAAGGALMRAEIREQPARWRELLTRPDDLDAAVRLLTDADPQLIVFAARGSSDHAAVYGQYLAHARLSIPALLATPAAVTALDARLRLPRAVVIAVSQSGSSPDIVATVDEARAAGAVVIALTNDEASPLALRADVHVPLSAGAERAVAATKTYTAEIAALHQIITGAAGAGWSTRSDALQRAADAVERYLESRDDGLDAVAELVAGADRLVAVGRGLSMASAREAALKLMETCAIAASGWSAADATHGPLGQVTPGTPVLAFSGSPGGQESVMAFARAAAALGGVPIAVGPGMDGVSRHRLTVALAPDDALIPLTEIVPIQLLAAEVASRLGRDPDAPAGLSKVTWTI